MCIKICCLLLSTETVRVIDRLSDAIYSLIGNVSAEHVYYRKAAFTRKELGETAVSQEPHHTMVWKN